MGVPGTFSNFMAKLALFNEGAPGHFFHLMEAPHDEALKSKDIAQLTL